MKSFLIHKDSCIERKDCVASIIRHTGAKLIDPVWCPILPALGCILSHVKVARMATTGYFVFEDDAVIEDPTFLEEPLDADVIYYGTNGYAFQTKPIDAIHHWGTHAMYISNKARLLFLHNWEKELEYIYPKGFPAIDEIWSVLIRRFDLTIKIYDYIPQKKGLRSYISHSIRN